MEGGYNQYPKQTKNNSALRIHLGNNKANAGAAVQDVVVPPTANVNASNDVVEHHGKQPLDPSQPKSCALREQDMYMPIANVIRIMRRILPSHAKISDDAKETVQECVSEFISFITGEANQHCRDEERKTITAEDIIWAMKQLDFNDYINPITTFMNRYRESQYGRPLAQKEPNSRRYGGGDIGEVVDCEPLRMDGTGTLAMGGAGPIGSEGPIGPAMYNLGPQQPFYDPSMMNPYNFRYNSSDSAGASSSLGYPPGFNPYAHYK